MHLVDDSDSEEASTQTSSAVDRRPGKIVDLPANLRRQFYPPIMLLEALSRRSVLEKRTHDDTSSRDDEYHPRHIFEHFVNRLAMICHVEPNGDAVSSCVVLQEPDRVVYIFASNHRSDAQLSSVTQAIRGILEIAPPEESSDEECREIHGKMLRQVLALCWCRVRHYLRALVRELGRCIESCRRSPAERDQKLGTALDQIALLVGHAVEKAEAAKPKHSDREQFTRVTEAVIKELKKLDKDAYLFSLIRRRVASEHKLLNGAYWTEMCHTSDRLKAYESAVDAILIARENWPELFENFEVRFIPSPNRIPNPLPPEPKTSDRLIQISTSNEKLPELRAKLAELQQKHDIDEMIADEWTKGIRPTVHAEVQVHSWLESSPGGTRSDSFFGKYKFIGSSKPTCKLCAYYFHNGTDIKVRPSHRNLYTHWRVPDLYDYELKAGETRRKELLHKIKKLVVADIERTISEKLADWRNHDSTDQRVGDVGSLLNASYADTMSSAMDNLSIVGEVDDAPDSVEKVMFQGRRRLFEPGRP